MSDRKRLEDRKKKLIELKCTQLQVMRALSEGEETMLDGGEACVNASEVEDDGKREQESRTIEEEEEGR